MTIRCQVTLGCSWLGQFPRFSVLDNLGGFEEDRPGTLKTVSSLGFAWLVFFFCACVFPSWLDWYLSALRRKTTEQSVILTISHQGCLLSTYWPLTMGTLVTRPRWGLPGVSTGKSLFVTLPLCPLWKKPTSLHRRGDDLSSMRADEVSS